MTDFPRLEQYLAQLPRGLTSYPECVLKGTVYRPFADSAQLDRLPRGLLTDDVMEVLGRRVGDADWVPEVHMTVLLLVYGDYRKLSEPELQRWIYQCNSEALGGRLLRLMMALATPGMLLSGAARRWTQLHHGTTLEVGPLRETNGRRETEVTVRFPHNLYGLTLLRGVGGSIEIALRMSRAKNVQLDVAEHGPRSARYLCSWD